MSTNTARLSALESRVSDLDAKIDRLLAAVAPDAPAKTTRPKKARKARKAAQPKADAPLPKGVRTVRAAGGTLSRKDWNRTLTAKARLAGGDTYKRVTAAWDDAQTARAAGVTPDEFLATFA